MLLHVPDDLRVGFPAVEIRMDERPGLGEVELIGRSFVPESRQKLARQSQRADLGPPAADVEDAVHQLLACNLASQVVGGQPDPRRGEVPAPVLIGITVAVFRTDQIAAAVPDNLALIFRLHPLRVPEHLEGLGMAEEVIGAKAHVEGDDLPDPEVPGHLTIGTHPFRVLS